jgi:predicted Zn-dependent protease with MMP-like domain
VDVRDDGEERFYGFVDAAVAAIPPQFSSQLGSVAIVVEDWPSPEQLRSVDAAGLFGLYQGVPRTTFGAENVGVPSKITIFRGPLEQRYRDPDALEAAVFDTVRHEIAHHLGISDARLIELQQRRL